METFLRSCLILLIIVFIINEQIDLKTVLIQFHSRNTMKQFLFYLRDYFNMMCMGPIEMDVNIFVVIQRIIKTNYCFPFQVYNDCVVVIKDPLKDVGKPFIFYVFQITTRIITIFFLQFFFEILSNNFFVHYSILSL